MSNADEIMKPADMYASKFHPLDIREARAALLKAVEALAADAARYRWLRDPMCSERSHSRMAYLIDELAGPELDDAIDKELKGTP